MNNSDSPPPSSPRRTLKLKVPARKPPEASKAPPGANVNKKVDSKPGAHWSDEYKRRMQADMDELNSGRD
ncbi:MAG TPA: hypothetical protein VGL87_10160 [Steroidobacteraceae bacterium]|jgi:hypothetical protein